MKIEKTDSEIKVELENQRVNYSKKQWTNLETFLTGKGVEKLEEWKIDLINNYGVEYNELQSTS